jgi:hypothetical protein
MNGLYCAGFSVYRGLPFTGQTVPLATCIVEAHARPLT